MEVNTQNHRELMLNGVVKIIYLYKEARKNSVVSLSSAAPYPKLSR